MKFKCVFVNKRTNKIINKDFTVDQIDKYMASILKTEQSKEATQQLLLLRGATIGK